VKEVTPEGALITGGAIWKTETVMVLVAASLVAKIVTVQDSTRVPQVPAREGVTDREAVPPPVMKSAEA
jgi:hypothetical protein